MSRNPSPPILVTGIHRSGSTFVGKMLTINKEIGYIQEPFNKFYGLDSFDKNFKYLKFNVVPEATKLAIDDLIHLNKATYHITSYIKNNKPVQDRLELFNEAILNINFENLLPYIGKLLFRSKSQLRFQLVKLNPFIDRILIKDPLAAFASQYLHQKYDMNVVILVRHPLSFAGSLKRLGWRFDFDNFLRQKHLMNDYLEEFRDELIYLQNKQTTVVEEAVMLWNCIYTVLADFIGRNPNFIVYKHEQIARHPLQSFKDLYKRLGLNFTPTVEKKIKILTSSDNPVEANNNKAHQFNRNSAALIHKWKDILTADEVEYVTEKTASLASSFYDEDVFLSK